MNPVTIDYIWEAIRESERSDELQFMDDELWIKTEMDRLARQRRIQAEAVGREPITKITLSPTHGR